MATTILCPCRGSNPDRPARSQTLYYLSYRGSYLIRYKSVTEKRCVSLETEILFRTASGKGQMLGIRPPKM
jgi:hypothetical protein